MKNALMTPQNAAAEQLRAFLIAAAESDAMLVPSQAVDEAWHAMLEQSNYEETCRSLCGQVVGHKTDLCLSDEAMQAAYLATQANVKAVCEAQGVDFQPELWPADGRADCGTDD